MSRASPSDQDPERRRREAPEPEGRLTGRLVRYTDGDELTMFPPERSDIDLMTRWITAEEGAYVSLEAMA